MYQMQRLSEHGHKNVAYRRLGDTLSGEQYNTGLQPNHCVKMVRPIEWLPPKLRPIPVIIGGICIHLTLGTMYSIGNMTPYIISYLRKYSHENVSYGLASWLNSMAVIGQGATTFLGGIIAKRFGARVSSAIGCFLVTLGVAVSYFSVGTSFWAVAFTYSMVFGFGVGIAYPGPLVRATQWLPRHKGVAIGMIVAGFGCGALIFNQVQTKFINPENLSPDIDKKYFSNDSLLERVPKAFFLLAGCYALLQLLGICLLCGPSENDLAYINQEAEVLVEKDDEFTVHPSVVIRSTTFWILWGSFFISGVVTVFISAFYKPYGQTFISDDYFLATTGSVASVGNALGRIAWGRLGDTCSYQVAMCCVMAILCLLFLTFQYAALTGKVFYFIWVVSIFSTFCGAFSLYPFATNRCFGQKYFGVNYGLLFTSQVAAAVTTSVISQTLLAKLGYQYMFFLLAFLMALGFVLTTLIGFSKYGRPCQRLDSATTNGNLSSEKQQYPPTLSSKQFSGDNPNYETNSDSDSNPNFSFRT